ncbi:hypothetical protein, partial [Streptomyces goshikiensis]|uniref:hypothetical protein n=1 Tax=Streptomyces goshikiensis TaxID=1942 RepID=UPI0033BBED2F
RTAFGEDTQDGGDRVTGRLGRSMRVVCIGIQSQLRRAVSIAARLLREADTARIDDALLCPNSTDGPIRERASLLSRRRTPP